MASRRKIAIFAGGLSICIVAAVSAPATAFGFAEQDSLADDSVTVQEVSSTLSTTDSLDSQLIAEPVPSDQTATLAAEAEIANGLVSIEVPRNPDDGISLNGPTGLDITIGLPDAPSSGTGTRLSDGTVAFAGSDSVATAVIPTETGIQLLTTIANSNGATSFLYPFELAPGQRIELSGDGGAAVLNADGTSNLRFAPAWSVDASGARIATHYETDGESLTQVVDHLSAETVYPVVADPLVYVDYRVTTVVNIRNHGVVPRWKQVNSCVAAPGQGCNTHYSESLETTIETEFGFAKSAVGASIGFSVGKTQSMGVTCVFHNSQSVAAKMSLYASAIKKTYQLRVTRYYGIQGPNRLRTQVISESRILTAYSPNGGFVCG